MQRRSNFQRFAAVIVCICVDWNLGNTFQSQRTWCTDYIFFGQSFSESPVYGFEYVVANPQVAPDIDQPDRLNQVAFRMIRYELPKC